jgi:hypothetical protein
MDIDRMRAIVRRFARPYRNAAEGLVISTDCFDLVPEEDGGAMFNAMCDHAERVIGTDVRVTTLSGWIRFVPFAPLLLVRTLQ